MLHAEEMSKLRIFTPKKFLKDVIEELNKAKAIEIIEHQRDELDTGMPFSESASISDAAVAARSMIFQLGIEPEPAKTQEKGDIQQIIADVKELHNEVSKDIARDKEIAAQKKMLTQNKEFLEAIEGLGIGLDLCKETKHIKYFMGFIDDPKAIRAELEKDKKITYELSESAYQGKPLIALFIAKDCEWKVLDMLRKHSFSDVKIPADQCGKKDALKALNKELLALEKEHERTAISIAEHKKKHAKNLLQWEKTLTAAARKAEAPLMFAATKNISLISGWVPKNRKNSLVKSLEAITDKKAHVEELEIKEKDAVPVKFTNPGIAKPYEFLLRLFSIPSYHELDPAIFMFFTFPIFFGFMLGDIGYGLVTLILFISLKKIMPGAKDLLNIMVFSSISSIIFGFVFGEFFGFELGEIHFIETFVEQAHLHYPLIHRSADTAMNLIFISLAVGFLHVNFGLLLGFVNIYRHHGIAHAFLEKGGWWLLQLGAAFIGLAMAGILKSWVLYAGIGIIALAGYVLFKGEGVQGLVELPSIFVHIGSYMRLMAIGLASVGLAAVINEQTQPMFHAGAIGIIGAILIFTIGHVINIGLGILGPFLHSLRLHYVEHFTKFYKGGGKEFTPFGADET